jgi:ABC-type uncharacterized transport system substrate-binding protein
MRLTHLRHWPNVPGAIVWAATMPHPKPGEEQMRRRDFIVFGGAAITLAVCRASPTETKGPDVFILVSDPVASKLVGSLAHPAGNITGLSNLSEDLLSKSTELFKKVVPRLSEIELMINPSFDRTTTERNIKQVQTAAERLGIRFQLVEAGQPDQIERAFPPNREGTNGVMVHPDGRGPPLVC